MSPRSPSYPSAAPTAQDGRRRAVVEHVSPQVDCGQFPVKRVLGEGVEVFAHAFADGHDVVTVVLRHRFAGEADWTETLMAPLGNDEWRASFEVDQLGRYQYTVVAWTDPWATWRRDLGARLEAGQDVSIDLLIGADLVVAAARRAAEGDAPQLTSFADRLRNGPSLGDRTHAALEPALDELMARNADRSHAWEYEHVLEVVVDPVLARFSSWYELFPRSTSPDPKRHGTFRDLIDRLPYVAGLGFDVLYLPPIHPIGWKFRKGPNNVTTAGESDPGVPWAIGSPEGGHTAIHPELGTLDDFHELLRAASLHGITVAMDIAFQASPDHPAVAEHPEWFRARPDGTIQYAENPPKKYQDIYPFDFESEDWQGLWTHLYEVFEYWIGQGVTVFRVDNPHTKAFPFWGWVITELKTRHPEALFLAEAFTRPKIMHRLAKLGFSQSYTYFTWRNTKAELTDYFTELAHGPGVDYFRPNVWPNTPDILHEYLQHGGRPAFEARLVLAATLSASYGVYGPAFELFENIPIREGSEEYLNSEKYEVRHWDLERPDSLAPLITRVNALRRQFPALQRNDTLAFHTIDDDNLLAYSKREPGAGEIILTVVNLDPQQPHGASLQLPLWEWAIDEHQPFVVEELLGGGSHQWHGEWHHIEIDPAEAAARIFRVHGSPEGPAW